MTDEELRFECLKLTKGTYPDPNFNRLDETEMAKYYCNVHKYRSELANQYFEHIKCGQTIQSLQLFFKRDDWVSTSVD